MASDTTPLLSEHRRQSEGEHGDPSPPARSSRRREMIVFGWAFVATTAFIILAVWTQHCYYGQVDPPRPEKRNLIFMVSDGMGPASLSLTRSYRQFVEQLPEDTPLTLDKHFWGTSRTRSSNSLVTDSAAGATAFSCGKKSYNGAIAILPDHEPCGTVLEAAKRAGYMTGLVVTTDITDATPACFASHVRNRTMNDEIALQEVGDGVLGRVVDIMLGGGRCHFLPSSAESSCRLDNVDVVDIAQKRHGWSYANDRKSFDALKGGENVELPMLGLFASTDIPYEIDRRNLSHIYPSLSELAKTALRALEIATKDSDKGFFLMIEGSLIDHAGHTNDPAAQVHEVLEYDKTFKAVVDFLENSDVEGLVVGTSDHETGGLSTALQEPGHLPVYNWYPRQLAKATASSELLSLRLLQHIYEQHSESKESLKDWINENLVIAGLGITNVHPEELDALVERPEISMYTFSAMISLRAHVGWSTHGHSAVDVNIYSSGGLGAEKIRGNIENTEIGKFLREYIDVDVDSITKELKEKMDKKTMGSVNIEGAETVSETGGMDYWSEHQRLKKMMGSGAY